MKNVPVLIFCDFDGTVAGEDVGYRLFHHFSGGRNEALIPEWKAGRITSREILEREAAMVRAAPEEVYRFLDQFKLDPGFAEFVSICQRNSAEPIIISEGMHFYMSYLLERHDLADLEVLANIGHLEDGGLRIEFPFTNRTCKRCGSCKGERIAEYRARCAPGTRVVFVGDGLSDVCAAGEADIVFAKKDLEQYCETENISYYKYSDFFEVAERLFELGLLKQ
jgi:2-hydroxy-3-keto-5-methylthiopentenyl-1-phosphate phosphatase